MAEEEERELLLLNNNLTLKKRFFKITKRIGRNILRNPLLVFTIAGVILGVAVGVAVQPFHPSNDAIELISFPGEIFLNMLKVLILPLIVFSLLTGLGAVDLKTSGLLGMWTCLYYFSTTFLAVILGIILVTSIHPGSGSVDGCGDEDEVDSMGHTDTLHAFLDIVRNMFPDNIIEAMYSQVYSNCETKQLPSCECNSTNENECTEKQCTVESRDGMNILGIIIFTIAFGIVLNSQGEASRKLFEVFSIINDAVMRLVSIVMCLLPLGIASLIAGKLVEVESYASLVQDLGLYMVTVLAGLFIHALIVLPLIYFIITRRNPFAMIGQISQALLTAFGTSSSSATLPVTIKCLEDNCGVDGRVTKFMLPLGATINMDGTALYEAVAAIFIAQLNGIDLSFANIVVISITATLASIGAAGVPMAGLFTMIIVLTAVDLPIEDVSLIIAVDWLLDRFRTTVNVLGDSFGTRIVERLSRKQLATQVIVHNGSIDDSNDATLHSSGSASDSLKGDNGEVVELHETHISTLLHDTTKL